MTLTAPPNTGDQLRGLRHSFTIADLVGCISLFDGPERGRLARALRLTTERHRKPGVVDGNQVLVGTNLIQLNEQPTSIVIGPS